jgi:hypothetical protein
MVIKQPKRNIWMQKMVNNPVAGNLKKVVKPKNWGVSQKVVKLVKLKMGECHFNHWCGVILPVWLVTTEFFQFYHLL